MAILQGARITGSIIATTFIKANGFSGSITASRLYVQGSVGIGTTSPVGKLHIVQNNAIGRYSYFGSNSGLFIKANDNSINSLLILENTQPAANYGASINFNLGYGGDQGTAGTAVLGSRIVAAAEQTWTSTDSTQDAYLAFHTTLNGSSSEKVRITSDGNVGIGSSSPAYKLDVAGSIYGYNYFTLLTAATYGPSDNSAAMQVFGSTGSGGLTNTIKFVTGGSERVRIDSDGNVGIGTTSTGYKLKVQSTGANGLSIQTVGSTSGNPSIQMLNGSVDTTISATSTGLELSTYNSYPLLIKTNNTERARFDTNGNLGIGTSSPAYILDVRGDIRIGNGSSSEQDIRFVSLNGDWQVGTNNGGNGTNNNQFYFYDSAYRLTIQTGTGNIGIGTTSPSYNLSISGSVGLQGNEEYLYFHSNYSVGNNARGKIRVVGAGGGSGYGGDLRFSTRKPTNVWNEDALTIDSSGNVGIGTTSPSSAASFNKVVEAYDATSISYQVNSGGTYKAEFGVSSNGGWLGTSTTHAMRFVSNGTERMRITSGGNVIIGNTTAYAGLTISDITANDGNDTLAFFYRGTSGNHESLVKFYDFRGQLNASLGNSLQDDGSGTQKADLVFKTSFNANPTERMRITNTGNVGIGSSSPAYKLDVSGGSVRVFNNPTTNNWGLTLENTNVNGWGVSQYFRLYGYNSTPAASFDVLQIVASYPGFGQADFLVKSQAQSTAATVMSLLGNGNVGIGTTSPTAKVHIVQSNSGGVPAIRLSEDESTIQGPSANTQIRMGSNLVLNASNVMPFNVNASETMRIINNGNIGIGTTTPLGKLHVYGLLRVGGAANEQTGIIALGNDANPVGTYGDNGMFRGGIGTLGSANYTNISSYQGIVFNVQNAAFGSQATRMIIDVNGNVGIGTTSPSWLLTVYAATAPQFTLQNGTRSFTLTNNSADNLLSFYYNSANRLQFDTTNQWFNSGNVGIGTTSPNTKLESYFSSNSLTFNYLATNLNNTSPIPVYSFDVTNGVGETRSIKAGVGYERHLTNGRGTMHFYNDSNNDTSNISGTRLSPGDIKMSIDNGGNVGIGTTIPATLLQVAGETSINYTNAILTLQGGTGYGFIRMYGNSSAVEMQIDAHSSNANAGTLGTFTNHPVYIKTNNSTKVSILTGGNVGIGTTSPSATLTVIATNNTGSRIQLGTVSTSTFMDANKVNDFMVLTAPFGNNPASVSNAGAKWGIKMNGSIDNINTKGKAACIYAVSEDGAGYNRTVGMALHTSGFDLDSAERVRINSSGNVGIGTTSPSYKLEVAGTLKTTSTITNDGGIYYGGGSNLDINQYNNGYMRFLTNNNEKMRITSDGDVGISNSSPLSGVSAGLTLGAIGTVKCFNIGMFNTYGRIRERDQIDALAITTNISDGGTQDSSTRSSWKLRMGWGNGQDNFLISRSPVASNVFSDLFYIKSDGNVGIGTTSPANKLHISGSSTNLPLKLEGLTSNATGYFLTVDNTTGVVYKSTGGVNGTSGTSGANGSPGGTGSSGTNGTSGTSGANGNPGTSGTSGANGNAGSSGITGTSGSSGSSVGGSPVRAYVYFNGTGTVTINGSNNVTSITDNGVGDYTVNFTTAFVDAYYAVSGTCTLDFTNASSLYNVGLFVPRQANAQVAGSCRLACEYYDNTLYDCVAVRAMFVRA